MKKNSLLKALGITFLVVVFLSWIIPVGSYSGATFTKGDITAIGLPDLITYPIQAFNLFGQYGLLFLVIGGFYGILNKTGVYSKLVNKIVSAARGNEKLILVVIAAILALLSSLTGLSLFLFVLVPFLATIILLLGYKKVTAMIATVGAILIGSIGSLAGADINHIFAYYLSDGVNNIILAKVILFFLVTGTLVAYLWFFGSKDIEKEEKVVATKKKVTKKEEVIPTNKVKTILFNDYEVENKSFMPLIIAVAVILLVAIVGMFSWYYVFKIQFFNDLYTSVTNFKIGGFSIVKSLLGTLTPMGNWDTIELSMILLIGGLLVGWLYSLKFKDIMDSFVEGAKEMLPTAIYVTLANVVFVLAYANSSSSAFDSQYFTIINKMVGTGGATNILSLVKMVGVAGVGSLYFNNLLHLFGNTFGVLSAVYTDASMFPIIGFIFQTINSLLMLVLPTSLVLVAGLSYFEVSYKEWFKKSWMYLAAIAGIILIMTFVVFMFLQ